MTLIQDLHAAISRRDWHAVEVAANRLRDADLEKQLAMKIDECAGLANNLDGYEADNAAKDARIKYLEDAIKAKGGNEHSPTQDAYDLACKAIEKHCDRAKALEAKLAAANEVAQLVIQAEEDKSGDPNFYILMMQTAYDKARAVLGGKP